MKKNMGNLDRTIRLVLAAVILLLTLTNVITGTLAYILLALGIIFAVTSLFSICPLYIPFKINTRKKE
ncbi:MAG: hypothetical protein QG611_1256 [Bacteroidota bacterium]|nr:hypothetical protein [Bacteroidota bacterium]